MGWEEQELRERWREWERGTKRVAEIEKGAERKEKGSRKEVSIVEKRLGRRRDYEYARSYFSNQYGKNRNQCQSQNQLERVGSKEWVILSAVLLSFSPQSPSPSQYFDILGIFPDLSVSVSVTFSPLFLFFISLIYFIFFVTDLSDSLERLDDRQMEESVKSRAALKILENETRMQLQYLDSKTKVKWRKLIFVV